MPRRHADAFATHTTASVGFLRAGKDDVATASVVGGLCSQRGHRDSVRCAADRTRIAETAARSDNGRYVVTPVRPIGRPKRHNIMLRYQMGGRANVTTRELRRIAVRERFEFRQQAEVATANRVEFELRGICRRKPAMQMAVASGELAKRRVEVKRA